MKKYLIFFATVFCFQSLNAQNLIKGIVRDEKNLPLVGANVYLPELNKGTITNANGFYELTGLPSGKLDLQFTYIGYTNRIESVTLSGSEKVMDVKLETKNIQAEEIVVTGGYSSTQDENVVKIDVLQLDGPEYKPTPNFTEVLTRLPGISMISKGSGVSKPVIRGLSMNDILVLNNGVKYENYQFSDHHPLGITEFGIEDVEVIKGPASLLYGSDAIGGVINFIRERPAPVGTIQGDYNAQLFSNTLGYVNNLGIKGSSKNIFGGMRFGQKSHSDFIQGGGEFVPNTRFMDHSLKLNSGHTGKTGTFKLFYDYTLENLGLAEKEVLPIITERGRKIEIYYQRFTTHLLSSQNRFYFGNMKLDVNTAYQSTELIHFGKPREYEIQMKLHTLTYEAKLLFPSRREFEYIAGYQGMSQKNLNLYNRKYILIPDASMLNNSMFFLVQKTFFSRLKMQSGLRYDNKGLSTEEYGNPDSPEYRKPVDKNYNNLSGSLGSTYHYSENLLFRANLATGYRTPNIAELASNGQHEARFEIGDQNLAPEKSYEADLSTHFHSTNITLDLAVFYNRISDYIFITPTGDLTENGIRIYRYMQSNSRLYGSEAGIHYHPVKAKWLHLMSTFSNVTGKQENGVFLPFIPAEKIYFELRTEKDKLKFLYKAFLMLNASVVFSQDDPAPEETPTDNYTLVNLSAGGQLKIMQQYVSVSFGISNIFDVKYIDHLSTLKEVHFNNPGRNISLSLKVPFGTRKK